MTYAEQLAAWEDACATVRNQRAYASELLVDYFGQNWPAPIRDEWLAKRYPIPPKPEQPKEGTLAMYGDEYRRGPNGDLEVWDDASWRGSAWTWDLLNAHVTSTDLIPKRRREIEAVLSLRHGHVPEPTTTNSRTVEMPSFADIVRHSGPKADYADELTRLRGTVSDYSDYVTAMKIRIAVLQESLRQAKTELAVRGPSKFRLPASPAAEPDKEG